MSLVVDGCYFLCLFLYSDTNTSTTTMEELDLKLRQEWQVQNAEATPENPYVPKGKLDSSLKKNTAFIKKIKTGLSAETHRNVLKEIETLSLEKYLSEIIVSIQEGIFKLSKSDDLTACMAVLTLLNRRFPGKIIPPVISVLVNSLVDLDVELPIQKPRNALKIVMEMQMAGLVESLEDCDVELLSPKLTKYHQRFRTDPIIIPVLRSVMVFRPETGYTVRIITLFIKKYKFILDGTCIPESAQQPLLDLFNAYTEKVIQVTTAQHVKVAKMVSKDKKISIKTGRQSDEVQEEIEANTELETVLLTNTTSLCEVLGREIPELEYEKEPEPEVVRSSSDQVNVWWEDSKEKALYKDIPTIDDILADAEIEVMPELDLADLRDADKVVEFVLQLEDVSTEQGVNRLVKIYMTQMPHNKATHNRLLRFFSAVPKVDNLKFLAKYLKITASLYPEIIVELIETLDSNFRSQIFHGLISFRNLYFFIELIKFDLIPLHVVFHKIRKMTMNITGTRNADILLIFYERCGKFLLLEPNYLETTKEMLKLLNEQSKSEKLSINEKLSLRNMFLIVNSFTSTKPTEKIKAVERGPVEDFVIQLIRRMPVPAKSYNTKFVLGILKQFMHVPKAQNAVLLVFQTPEELPLDKLFNMAMMLGDLGVENQFIVHRICDSLVEGVIRGLELNDYRQNTARTSQIKLLAALVNAMVLSIRCAIDLLFKVICFGHPNNLPLPNSEVHIDQPDDYFRIHLVCTFLKSLDFGRISKANMYKRGTKSIEGLLVFLQFYIFCKQQPVPRDVQFMIEDTFAAYNHRAAKPFTRAADLQLAMIALKTYTSAQAQDVLVQEEVLDDSEYEVGDSESESESESELEESEDEADEADETTELTPAEILDSEELIYDSPAEEEEEYRHVRESATGKDKVFEAKQALEMDAQIRQLMNQSLLVARATPFKVPAPSTFVNSDAPRSEGPMKFAFLRRNHEVKELLLPSNNHFAERIEREQAAQKANREKILRLINNMDS